MKIKYTLYIKSAIYWLRSLLFFSEFGKSIEKLVLNYKSKHVEMEIDGYLPLLDDILKHLSSRDMSFNIKNISVLEIGTGQNMAIPIMLKFLGVGRVITTDINNLVILNYVKSIVKTVIQSEKLRQLASKYSIIPDCFELQHLFTTNNLDHFINILGIEYFPHVDLSSRDAKSNLCPNGVDLVISNNVLEHIPKQVLKCILTNASTFGAEMHNCTQLHHVDLGDHFADVISGLHPLNYYRYSNANWRFISGNRYMYQNRLTVKDYETIASNVVANHTIEVREYLQFDKWEDPKIFANEMFKCNRLDVLRIKIILPSN